MNITLEEATCDNTCEYSITGMILRSKLLWKMKINPIYGIVAIEIDGKIYKAYIWNGSVIKKKIGDIFYIKFGIWSDDTRSYYYEIYDENKKYDNDRFTPEYRNKYTPYTPS